MNTLLNATNTTTSVTVTDIDFQNDFAELETGKANEKVYQKITGNVDQPASVRVAIDDVKNVYAGTDIQPALYSIVKKGKRLLVSLRNTIRVTNETTQESVDYPLQTNVVFQYPVSANINAEHLLANFKDAISAVIHGPLSEGDNEYDHLNRMMRGSLAM